jgi:hypothetical protein
VRQSTANPHQSRPKTFFMQELQISEESQLAKAFRLTPPAKKVRFDTEVVQNRAGKQAAPSFEG